jgi:hypothetical protein
MVGLVNDDERKVLGLEVVEPSPNGLNETNNHALPLVVFLASLRADSLPGDGAQVVTSVLKQLFEMSQDENSSLPMLDELAKENGLAQASSEDDERRTVLLQVPEAGIRCFLLVVTEDNRLLRRDKRQARCIG